MSEAATKAVFVIGKGSAAPAAPAAPNQATARLSIEAGFEFLRDFARFAGWRGAWAVLLIGLGALLENVGLVLIIPFLGLTMDAGAAGARVGVVTATVFKLLHAEARVTRLFVLLAFFASLLVLRALVISARTRLLGELRIGFIERRRREILRRLAATSWERVLKLRHARVMQVIGGDIDRAGALAQFALDGLVALLVFASQCAVALLLAPKFAALSMVLLGAATLRTGLTLRRGYHLGSLIAGGYLALTHSVGQLLGGLKLAMSQNMQTAFVTEFEETITAMKRRQLDFLRQQATDQAAFSTLFGLSGAVCAFIGFGLMDMPAPVVITLLLILTRMSGPALQIFRSAQQFAHGLSAYERLQELELELPPETTAPAAAGPVSLDRHGPIVFRAVTFAHGDRNSGDQTSVNGVRDLNLQIEAGEIVGVTGPSGAGKTTFADLLVGLIRPQSGTIMIGGTRLDGAALASWRNAISYVSQDPFLFHDTIRRNLLWANDRASEAELWAALTLAGADRLVSEMANGLDTIVGERGSLVSGGERQRIALARAVLRRPRLLVLDEATSAIDVAGERTILAAVGRLQPAPTTVIVAHRQESLQLCARILTFENGRLVASRGAPG
ncbi:MAG: ABC transporter ATP-binding protein [Roseiarcus sp.]